LRVKVKVKLEEIAKGVDKKIKVRKYVTCQPCKGSGAEAGSAPQTCPTCKGSGEIRRVQNTFLGQMMTSSTCTTCNGEGRIISSKCKSCYGEGIVSGDEVIDIKLPAGVVEGMQLSLRDKGNAAPKAGINGDLIIVIEEEEHPLLHRDGINVFYNLPLSISDAALGTKLEVPTIEGKAEISIPPGTQPGKIFKLRGKGIPDIESRNSVGDQLVVINVHIPTKLSNEEKSIIERLKESENFKPGALNKEEKNFFGRVKEFFS
jgi:molecular chaperone DnaJ